MENCAVVSQYLSLKRFKYIKKVGFYAPYGRCYDFGAKEKVGNG